MEIPIQCVSWSAIGTSPLLRRARLRLRATYCKLHEIEVLELLIGYLRRVTFQDQCTYKCSKGSSTERAILGLYTCTAVSIHVGCCQACL